MDLDGTSVHSEGFWIWIIERTTASLLGNPSFELEPADLPFVSGHSVSEHLTYCVRKYCPDKTVEEARDFYFEHTRREMRAILDGGGRADAFVPAPGLKEFLLALKDRGIKIALVTSGLHEKAWPEIVAAFRALKPGRPARLLRCDHHRRVPAAPGRGRHAGRAVAQAAPLALRRGRARRSGHPVRGAQLGVGHRGQRRGGLRHPPGRFPDRRDGGRQHHRERDAGAV